MGSHNFQLCVLVSLQGLGHGAGEDTSLTTASHKTATCYVHTAEDQEANAYQLDWSMIIRAVLISNALHLEVGCVLYFYFTDFLLILIQGYVFH